MEDTLEVDIEVVTVKAMYDLICRALHLKNIIWEKLCSFLRWCRCELQKKILLFFLKTARKNWKKIHRLPKTAKIEKNSTIYLKQQI